MCKYDIDLSRFPSLTAMTLDIEGFPSKSDKFLVRVAFLEIYNEKISDLMVCYRTSARNVIPCSNAFSSCS